MHTSVFLKEAVDALDVKEGGKYIDATYGLGGHTKEIIKRGGVVLAIDWDKKMVEKTDIKNAHLVFGNYAQIEQIAKKYNYAPCDGVIFDLGLSMDQLAQSGKGFSYQNDGEMLDMRISGTGETAAEIINTYSIDEFIDLLGKYSEDIFAKHIGEALVKRRKHTPVKTVRDIKDSINSVVAKEANIKKNAVYARIFQALRIMVNNEMENIKQGIIGALQVIKKEGKVVVITFHSLEDRLVKLQAAKMPGIIEKRIQVKRERRLQAFERSARLRVLAHSL